MNLTPLEDQDMLTESAKDLLCWLRGHVDDLETAAEVLDYNQTTWRTRAEKAEARVVELEARLALLDRGLKDSRKLCALQAERLGIDAKDGT